jgi:hypothetical protein
VAGSCPGFSRQSDGPFIQLIHEWGAWAFAALIELHAAAALFHRFVLRDGVFQRMWFFNHRVSKSFGATTMSDQTTRTSTSRGEMQVFETKSASPSTRLSRRELMTLDEIMRLGSSMEILLRQGEAPVIVAKVRYYMESEFKGLLECSA